MTKKVLEGEVVPRPGPRCKYDSSYCKVICEIAEQGGHISAMRASIGRISKDTWYRWQEEYPEFKEAVEEARLLSQVYYEALGLQGIKGSLKGFNANTYALVMYSKFDEDYKKDPGTEINIVNNTLNLTSEEVQLQIDQKLEKLKSAGLLSLD